MLDINQTVNNNLIKKVCITNLSTDSYFWILLYILVNYRFSVNFCRKVSDLIDKFTPSLSGDEDKERNKDEV